jgi:hypothetical protein
VKVCRALAKCTCCTDGNCEPVWLLHRAETPSGEREQVGELRTYLGTTPLTLVRRLATWSPTKGQCQQNDEFWGGFGAVSDVHAAQSWVSRHSAQQSCQLLTGNGIRGKSAPLYVKPNVEEAQSPGLQLLFRNNIVSAELFGGAPRVQDLQCNRQVACSSRPLPA